MAIDWGAFVKGWAGSAADSLKERDKDERDWAMREKLAVLQEKYQIKEEERTEARNKTKVASEIPDYSKGVAKLYNSQKQLIGERPLTESEIEDRTLSVTGAKLDNDNKRSTIEARTREQARQDAALELDRQRTGATIDSLKRGGAGADSTGAEDRGTSPEDRLAMNILKQAGVKTEGLDQNKQLNNARAAVRAAVKRKKPELAFQIYTTMQDFPVQARKVKKP